MRPGWSPTSRTWAKAADGAISHSASAVARGRRWRSGIRLSQVECEAKFRKPSQEIGGGGSRYAGQSCGELYCSSPPERPSAKFSELHARDFHRPIAHHHALDTLVNESILY